MTTTLRAIAPSTLRLQALPKQQSRPLSPRVGAQMAEQIAGIASELDRCRIPPRREGTQFFRGLGVAQRGDEGGEKRV